ncbi:hypothetical protein HF324_09100 [Chitinophaga oryzae]|uniref:Uncharacterized protein n=1 Tax=Chitinophaga oryzae TaxID=2725414 RepID=A0AAE7D6Q1_9BACT|nr:hypothetical protein [Chitinophaga oryzae]QJB31517.1 hypothetical protein HF329_09445 [Chitinophaga oryzae]QJB37999.1 hypothetical protein HF324_09100 [Chitinophaga oryzae]
MDHYISKGQSDQEPLSLASFISYPYQNFQGVPVTQFTAGSPFSVRWDSNGTNFNLYVSGNPQPLHTGAGTSADLPQGLQTNTTLILEADNNVDKRYAFLTIIISNPVLTPETIWHDTGNMTNAGTLNVEGSLYNTTLTFGSEGVLNMGDNGFFQDLTVSQTSKISGTAFSNGLQSPTSNINSLTITNNLKTDGTTIAMIGGGHLLKFGIAFDILEVTAKTDGFAIITINPKDCDTNVASSCTITYGLQQYTVNGMVLEEDSTADIPQSGYCCIPIRNGDTWSCSGSNSGGDKVPLISVFWVPLGGGSDSYTTSGGN